MEILMLIGHAINKYAWKECKLVENDFHKKAFIFNNYMAPSTD